MVVVAGLDEAGRGPVVGSMVVCAYALDESKQDDLKALGVKDSKLLSIEKRQALFQSLQGLGAFALVDVRASELNARMKKRESLTDIEADAMASALLLLEKKTRVERVFVDCPDPVPDAYRKRLKRFYPGHADLVCAHKADVLYPVVSAASILAKVTRDARLQDIKDRVGEDFGSGYSHDEKTISFLKRHWKDKKHPIHEFVRSQWATAKNLSVSQFKLDEFV